VQDDETPRQSQDRTGSHKCISCLAEVLADEYFRNDFLCDACIKREEFPLKSTPEVETRNDER